MHAILPRGPEVRAIQLVAPPLLCLILAASGVWIHAERWMLQASTDPDPRPPAGQATEGPPSATPVAGEGLFDEVRYFTDLAALNGIKPD